MAKFVEERYIKDLRVLKVALSRNEVRNYFLRKEQQQQQQQQQPQESNFAKKRCAISLEIMDIDDVSVKIRQPQPMEKIAKPKSKSKGKENTIKKPIKETAKLPKTGNDVYGEHIK